MKFLKFRRGDSVLFLLFVVLIFVFLTGRKDFWVGRVVIKNQSEEGLYSDSEEKDLESEFSSVFEIAKEDLIHNVDEGSDLRFYLKNQGLSKDADLRFYMIYPTTKEFYIDIRSNNQLDLKIFYEKSMIFFDLLEQEKAIKFFEKGHNLISNKKIVNTNLIQKFYEEERQFQNKEAGRFYRYEFFPERHYASSQRNLFEVLLLGLIFSLFLLLLRRFAILRLND